MDLPRVSIVVTAYLKESKPYLDACIQSLHNLNYPKELLDIVLITPTWYFPEYENVRRIHPCFGAYHNPIAVNYGFEQSNQNSKYVLMINDDVIMTKNSLMKMVMVAGDNKCILGAISNCDQGGFYDADLPLGLNKRQYRLEEIQGQLEAMMNSDLPTSPVRVLRPPTLYLYANLYPRLVWREVRGGTKPDSIGFDEGFFTGFDDTDYCIRARNQGVVLGIVTDALVWHMSGVSADVTMGDLKSDRRAESEKLFRKKWNL